MKIQTFKDFASHDKLFRDACYIANIMPTTRQASKFRRKTGAAYKIVIEGVKDIVIPPLNPVHKRSDVKMEICFYPRISIESIHPNFNAYRRVDISKDIAGKKVGDLFLLGETIWNITRIDEKGLWGYIVVDTSRVTKSSF